MSKPKSDNEKPELDLDVEARVIPADESDEERSKLCVWGEAYCKEQREWFRYFCVINPSENTIPGIELDYSPDLNDWSNEPEIDSQDFLDSFPDYSHEELLEVSPERIRQSIKRFFSGQGRIEKLKQLVEDGSARNDEENSEFSNIVQRFVRSVFSESFESWTCLGRFAGLPLEQQKEKSNQSTGPDDLKEVTLCEDELNIPLETEERIETIVNSNLPLVSVKTSVVKGSVSEELGKGDEIQTRFKGTKAEALPDQYIEREDPCVSIPFESIVLCTEQDPDLPGELSGDSEEMWRIVVYLPNKGYAEGYLHKDEQIVMLSGNGDEDDQLEMFTSRLSMMVLFGCLILALIIAMLVG